ncbi:aldo/keto reductase [Nocardia brevicatena]|uniref:aldo/keto reductase n=1 Tax=Nocardia brevicatena TaxID=37327 RepID=UPI00030EEFCD|nr:aldo/keto reductase [Nocardia brevicatena]
MTRYRLFGRTGWRVSELVPGTMAIADEYRRILEVFAHAGGDFVDTASAYGAGEERLGSVVDRCDRFLIGTEYTLTRDPGDPNTSGNQRENLTCSLDQSLRRLRTDYFEESGPWRLPQIADTMCGNSDIDLGPARPRSSPPL